MNNRIGNKGKVRELDIHTKDDHMIDKIVDTMMNGTYYYIMMSFKSLYLYKRGNSRIEYVYYVTDNDSQNGILTVYEDSIILSNKGTIYDLSINI